MHNKKAWTTLLAGGIASAMLITGCGSAASGNSITVAESTVTGTVSSIDGDTIVLSANTGMNGAMGQMQQGNAPQDMSGGNSSDSQTPPDMPSDSNTDSSTGESGTENQQNNQTPPEMPSNSANGGQGGSDMGSAPSDAGTNGQTDNQTPPEKPDGESDNNSAPAEVTDSNSASGQASQESSSSSSETEDGSSENQDPEAEDNGSLDGQAPGGDMDSDSSVTYELVLKDTSVLKDDEDNSIEISEIEEGDILTVTIDEKGNITSVVLEDDTQEQGGAGMQGGMGSSNSAVSYTALQEFTQDSEVSDETYDSTGTDENAVLISNGATVSLNNITATRNSSDSTGGDNSSFYGVGADVLATDGTAYVNGGSFTTDANGGAGLFAYSNGVIYASDATINTSADTSGGIHVAGGGTLYAWDLNVTTAGNSSAAIRSDRGGGTIVADGGSYTSTGTGSPAVYTTADITVNDATLTAENSEAICLEGKNTLRLYDCDLSGNMKDDEQNDCTWNVILYQSMSGDSEEGEGSFQMVGGSLTANNGGQFYTTNTQSTFYLSDVDITNADDSEFFLRCTGNNNQRGWGSSGSNGADCNFTASNQVMEGDVIYDSISDLDFYMLDGSSLTGAFIDDETYAGNGGSGKANLYIDADSTWIVTGDSTLSSLQCEGTIKDSNGKTVTIKGTDGTVYVQGDSEYTVTVESYSTTADVSGAASADAYSSYAVEQPEQLS